MISSAFCVYVEDLSDGVAAPFEDRSFVSPIIERVFDFVNTLLLETLKSF